MHFHIVHDEKWDREMCTRRNFGMKSRPPSTFLRRAKIEFARWEDEKKEWKKNYRIFFSCIIAAQCSMTAASKKCQRTLTIIAIFLFASSNALAGERRRVSGATARLDHPSEMPEWIFQFSFHISLNKFSPPAFALHFTASPCSVSLAFSWSAFNQNFKSF